MSHALDRAVVHVELVGDEPRTFQGSVVHRESVVLAGDIDPSVVHDGLVASAVSEFHLVCLSAQGEGGDLVSEADPEEGDLHGEVRHSPGGLREYDGVRRVPGSVAEEDSLHLAVDDDIGGGVVGEHDDVVSRAEVPEDAPLLPAVQETDGDLLPFIESLDGFAADLPDEVALGWRGGCPEFLDEVGYGFLILGDGAFECSAVPDLDDEVPGVDAGDPRDLVVPQEFVDGLAGVHVGGFPAVLAYDDGPRVDLIRLVEAVGRPVVSDEGERHDEDLTPVGGIRETFLITAHSRSENYLSESVGAVSEGLSFVDRPVLEDQITSCHRGKKRNGKPI